MGLKRVSWVRRYQGQCRALRPLGHQGYRLRNQKKDQPLCSGYTAATEHTCLAWHSGRMAACLYPKVQIALAENPQIVLSVVGFH